MCLLGTHPWGEINDQGIHLTCFIIHSGERAETRVRERKRDDGRRGSKWVGVRSSWEGEKGSHGKENTGTVEKSFYMGFQFTALCFAIFMFLWFQYQFIAVKASTNCQSDRKIVANIFNIWDFEPNARISYFLMREIYLQIFTIYKYFDKKVSEYESVNIAVFSCFSTSRHRTLEASRSPNDRQLRSCSFLLF